MVNSWTNEFDPLDDELIISIFNKVLDAKWLFRCYMVSQHFANLVCRVENVSVSLARHIPFSEEDETAVFCFLDALKDLISLDLELPFLFDGDWEMWWLPLLKRKGATLNTNLLEKDPEMSCLTLLKWKIARFSTNVESFVFFMATSLLRNEHSRPYEEEEEEGEVEEDDAINMMTEELRDRLGLAIEFLFDASGRISVLLNVLEKHTKLQNVTITDTMKRGKICASHKQLVELRNLTMTKAVASEVDYDTEPELVVRYAYLPSLHLLRSGYVMKEATLVFIRQVDEVPRGDDSDDHADGEILAGSFDGDEEGAFSEAVEKIMKNHKSWMTTASIEDVL